MRHRLQPHQQDVLDRMERGEQVVLDKTDGTRAFWRLTCRPVKLSVLRTLRKRKLIRLYARRAPGVTIWEASKQIEQRRAA